MILIKVFNKTFLKSSILKKKKILNQFMKIFYKNLILNTLRDKIFFVHINN